MDLYSAAKRLTRPFVFTEGNRDEPLPIGARGIIGDGFSCALVRADGAIDWLCLPRFDSPSVFGALLDPERGGLTAITPATRPFESLQRYDPDTNVLETLLYVAGQGVVRLTDYMPWTDDPRLGVHEVHRRVQCVEGGVDLVAVFDPRFHYGADVPAMEQHPHGVLARGSRGDRLVAVLGEGASWQRREAGGMEARFHLRAGERRWMVMSWDAPHPEPLAAYRPYDQLRATRHRWREWARQLQYDGPWRHHVLRSALVLKLLMYAPTGAMVAAPTASLPEWIGGQRNWDYRFTWSRDSAMAIRATNLIGFAHEARDFFHFVRDTLEHDELKVMYAVDGHPVPNEEVLSHLSGYRGSVPVRIGNGARDQVQLDTAGALLDAAYIYERAGGQVTLRAWRHMAAVADAVRERWQEPDHGIWEPRDGRRHNVHSKLMSWVALDRAAELAPLFGAAEHQKHWSRSAAEVHHDLCQRGLDASGQHFVMAYGFDEPDAALLLLPIHGLLEADDPRIRRTVDWVRSELGSGPYLRRYLVDDGVGGPEGAFALCGFWLAEVLAMAGRLDEAQEVFVAHAEASNHLGLLAEEINPATGELLGNFPQAFSHLGLINAAARIDLALRLQDEGSSKVPHFLLEHVNSNRSP
ncbi:MAG: glycoside hydrolase family 15 protein [Myxococcota bacterium]